MFDLDPDDKEWVGCVGGKADTIAVNVGVSWKKGRFKKIWFCVFTIHYSEGGFAVEGKYKHELQLL